MQTSTSEKDPDRSVDPVCGMFVSHTSEYSFDLNGDKYFFCCEPCALKFADNPKYYLERDPAATATTAIPGVSLYICPMDPEIEQDHRGSGDEPEFSVGHHSRITPAKHEDLGSVIVRPKLCLQSGLLLEGIGVSLIFLKRRRITRVLQNR